MPLRLEITGFINFIKKKKGKNYVKNCDVVRNTELRVSQDINTSLLTLLGKTRATVEEIREEGREEFLQNTDLNRRQISLQHFFIEDYICSSVGTQHNSRETENQVNCHIVGTRKTTEEKSKIRRGPKSETGWETLHCSHSSFCREVIWEILQLAASS